MDPAAKKLPEAEQVANPTTGRTPEQDRIIDEAIAEALRGQPPLSQDEIDGGMRECESG